MSDPVGAGINPRLLTEYESGLGKYDEYYLKNIDAELLKKIDVIEYGDDRRKAADSPYMLRLKEEKIEHKYALMLRERGEIKGTIALFEPLTDRQRPAKLSPKYLEVVAPFVAQEYLNTREQERSDQIVSILQTVLNTSEIGVALFDRRKPDNIIYYNPICTKYCFDFVEKGHPRTIIADFLKSIVIPFDRPYPKVKELSMELPTPRGDYYKVRIIDDREKSENMCILFISPKSCEKIADESYQNLFSQLTPKEREITLMISQGMTNGQIADKLFITLSTVKSHIQHIFEKASVSNRTSLMALMNTSDSE